MFKNHRFKNHRFKKKAQDVVVKTFNVGDGPAEALLRSLEKVAETADVILGQEFADRIHTIVKPFIRKHPEWAVAYGKRHHAKELPIFYKRHLGKRWFRTISIPIGYLGPQGKGGTRIGFKSIAILRLRHFAVINHHVIASYTSTHGAERVRRTRAARKQVYRFFRAVARHWRCVGGGDWNGEEHVILSLDPNKPKHWHFYPTDQHTHRDRIIDILGAKRMYPVARGVEETWGSLHNHDHRCAWVRFRLYYRV